MLARRLPSILADDVERRSARSNEDLQRRGVTRRGRGRRIHSPFSRAPHHTISQVVALRRRFVATARRDIARAERRTFSRRDRRIFEDSTRNHEATSRRGHDRHSRVRRERSSIPRTSFALVAIDEPMPVRLPRHARDNDCRLRRCQAVAKYVAKLSVSVALDRIDIHVDVARVAFDEMVSNARAESSTAIRERVIAARAIQVQTFRRIAISHERRHRRRRRAPLVLRSTNVRRRYSVTRPSRAIYPHARSIASRASHERSPTSPVRKRSPSHTSPKRSATERSSAAASRRRGKRTNRAC